jgi:hypothetical protein
MITLMRLAEEVEGLLDESERLVLEDPREAELKLFQARDLIVNSPGNWKINPKWNDSRRLYDLRLPGIQEAFLDRGYDLDTIFYNPIV